MILFYILTIETKGESSMKKKLTAGVLAGVLIAGGGLGFYRASAEEPNTGENPVKQEMEVNGMMESGDMQEMMQGHKMNFGQMKPHMKDMHPELTDKQMEEHYKSMHGTGGAADSKNFQR
jgi:hypothetical protein